MIILVDSAQHASPTCAGPASPVRPNVLSGRHKQHTGHAPRRGCVYALDMRVRHGRARSTKACAIRETENLQPLGVAGLSTQLWLAPPGQKPDKVGDQLAMG